MSCCSNSARIETNESNPEVLSLEFLFLDEDICKPCGGTGKALDEAVEIVAAPLQALGIALEVERIHVATREDAIAHKLITSPTIRINGQDIDLMTTQEECSTCSEIAGGKTTVDCRTWHWKGNVYSSAPTGKIVEAILSAAIPGCNADTEDLHDSYELPENLNRFFRARSGDGACSCQGGNRA